MKEMKVVPQVILFLVLVVIGWFAYENYEPFKALTDDIVEYAGLSEDAPLSPPVENVIDTRPEADGEVEQLPAQVEKIDIVAGETAIAAVAEPVGAGDDAGITLAEQPTAVVQDESVVSPETAIAPASDRLSAAVPASVSESDLQPTAEADTMDTAPATSDDILVDTNTPEPVEPASVGTAVKASSQQRKHQALTGLASARRAWLEGDQDGAIEQYQVLMEAYSSHPDFAGELGNIYFSRGQTELAVDAYAEAVLRLLKNGDVARARQVHAIVLGLDPEQGNLLREYFEPLR